MWRCPVAAVRRGEGYKKARTSPPPGKADTCCGTTLKERGRLPVAVLGRLANAQEWADKETVDDGAGRRKVRYGLESHALDASVGAAAQTGLAPTLAGDQPPL